MSTLFQTAADTLKKALEARKHPGIDDELSFPEMVRQGLPYLISRQGNARPPKTVYLNINSVCNLHCKMCDVGTFNEESNFFKNLRIDRKLKEITPQRFKALVDELERFQPMMSINGTEPLLYRQLGEIIDYARSRGMLVSVTTGGYDLPRRAEELSAAGLTRLNVSIDGPPSVHNLIRGRPDSFERATSGIRAFHAATKSRGGNAQIFLNCTITNLNYGELTAFYDSIADLPVERINFGHMSFVTEEMAREHNIQWGEKYHATVTCLSDEVRPEKMDVSTLTQQIVAVKSKAGERAIFLPDFSRSDLETYYREPFKFIGHIPCVSTWFIAQIMANGEVIPYTRCYPVVLGNINEESFLSIWNGERARLWRKDLRSQRRFPACSRCNMAY